MAARRLLIVMLVLLGFSTLAAALVQPPAQQEGTGSTIAEETEPTIPDPLPKGKGLGFDFEVGGEKIQVVQAEVGDQLSLVISSKRSDLLEIPAFGLLEAVGPGSPARFQLLVREPGAYGIRFVEANRVVARIEARGRGDASRSRAPGESAPDATDSRP
jgi:hypothetical protein